MDEAVKIAVGRWLAKAANDLRTAETMVALAAPVVDTACYHAQQCVEKGLKAFLTAAGRHVERTHSLPRLVELCAQENPSFRRLEGLGAELTDYAVQGRYPDDWREIPLPEAQAAVQKAQEALDFMKCEIEKRMRA